MEIAIAMSPEDYRAHTSGAGQEGGFRYSGSFAGRNIEKIYALGGLEGSLEAAVLACFAGPRRPEHVLVVSGFYVLHGRGGNPGTEPGVAAGSCETDGPLGALALLRAFAARGVRASLYCEPHNGPVMRAGYEAMLSHYDAAADDGSGRDGGGAARAMAATSAYWAEDLSAFADNLRRHDAHFAAILRAVEAEGSVHDFCFTNGLHRLGLQRADGGWHHREWAPAARTWPPTRPSGHPPPTSQPPDGNQS